MSTYKHTPDQARNVNSSINKINTGLYTEHLRGNNLLSFLLSVWRTSANHHSRYHNSRRLSYYTRHYLAEQRHQDSFFKIDLERRHQSKEKETRKRNKKRGKIDSKEEKEEKAEVQR